MIIQRARIAAFLHFFRFEPRNFYAPNAFERVGDHLFMGLFGQHYSLGRLSTSHHGI